MEGEGGGGGEEEKEEKEEGTIIKWNNRTKNYINKKYIWYSWIYQFTGLEQTTEKSLP